MLKDAGVQLIYAAATPRSPVVRVPLAGVAETPGQGLPAPCPRCGSRAFSVHQRKGKRLKDPYLAHALIVRYLCKRCRYVGRAYPAGVGPSRQSRSLKHLSALLYWIGLSYLRVQAVLADLGCPLSTTSIRRNVEDARRALPLHPPLERLALRPVGAGQLRGPDGMVTLRLVRHSPAQRSLEAEIAPGHGAVDLGWRLEAAAEWLAPVFS